MTVEHTSEPSPRAARVARDRAEIHAFFAEAWAPSDPREARARGFEAWREAWDAVAQVLESHAATGAASALRGVEDGGDALAVEHHALLCARVPTFVAPYESVNRDVRRDAEGAWQLGLLRGVPWRRVKVAYRRQGFEPELDANLELDHVTIELRFLVALTLAEAQAFQAGDVERAAELRLAQAQFLDGHLLEWLPVLAARLREHAASTYFGAMADATLDWLAMERESLKVD